MVIKKEILTIVSVIILSFLLRVVGINFGLPYLYQTEEYITVNYSLKMAGTREPNPKFFIYPSLYLYFMAFIFGITFVIGKIIGVYPTVQDFAFSFIRDPSVIYIVGRFFSAFFGTLVVIATYFLAKLIYNTRTALISAFMLGILPIWVRYSHYIKPEMCSNFLVVLYVLFLYKFYLTEKQFHFYYAAILLGLAVSTKYLSLPAIILMPLVYFYKAKKIVLVDKKFWFGIFLVILFFVLGTPFSVFDFKTFYKDLKGIAIGPMGGEMQRNVLRGILVTFKDYIFMGNETPIIGLICLLGVIYGLSKVTIRENILIGMVIVYFFINMTHYFPAWGFLFTAFPFYVILGGKFISDLLNKTKLAYIVFFLFLFPLYESIKINISFNLKDTRTIAKEWIEENIPFGKKILIDRYPNSPPLKMTKKQLENLFKKAVELNHYKKEYLKLQFEAHPGESYGYEIYEIYHPPHEIGTVTHFVEEAQKVRALIDVSKGIKYLVDLGIEYVILNSYSEMTTTTESIKNFYRDILNYTLLKEFKPNTKFHPGPVIKIFKLNG